MLHPAGSSTAAAFPQCQVSTPQNTDRRKQTARRRNERGDNDRE